MKQIDKNWWDHLKPGDTFHTGNPVECGICGCESDYWTVARWVLVAKLCLICPGGETNPTLHEKIDRKKELLYKDELPASVMQELKREIIQMKSQLRAQVAAGSAIR